MRLTRLVGLGVALAAAVGTSGAQQPAGASVKPTPELSLWSPSSESPLLNAGPFQNYFMSVDRDAYVTALEVGRDGRMRVLYPRSPKDAATKLKAGKTVSVAPWSYDILGIAVAPAEVPYVIALASDDPIDLSRFGQGKSWQYRMRLERARYADETMEAVARLVARDSTQRFAGDYGYIAPRISPSTQMALSRCTSLTNFALGRDGHDYWLYRDLWMSFGPRDGFWLASVSPWLGWGWNGLAPMLFPSVAAWPTAGGGCTPTLRLPSYAVAPEVYNVIQRPDTTRRDSTLSDSTKAPRVGGGGSTIAVEVPRAGAPETGTPGDARRFTRDEITRARTDFHTEADGNRAHAEAIAQRHTAAPVDRRGGSWAPEPIDARPTSRGAGGSRYAEQEERMAPRWPSGGAAPRSGTNRNNDPMERAYTSPVHARPTAPASTGDDATRGAPRASTPASPVTGGERGTGGASPRPGGSSGPSGSSGSSGSSASSPAQSPTAPRGQQQQNQ